MINHSAIRNAEEIKTVAAFVTVVAHPPPRGAGDGGTFSFGEVELGTKIRVIFFPCLHFGKDEDAVTGVVDQKIDLPLTDTDIFPEDSVAEATKVRCADPLPTPAQPDMRREHGLGKESSNEEGKGHP